MMPYHFMGTAASAHIPNSTPATRAAELQAQQLWHIQIINTPTLPGTVVTAQQLLCKALPRLPLLLLQWLPHPRTIHG
jgi:hypothetical protein